MAEGGCVSLAQLKRDLDSLSQQIFQIDLKIQQFRQQNNTQHIPNLEAAKKRTATTNFTETDCFRMAAGPEQEGTALGGYHGGTKGKPFLGLCTGKAIQ